jgi:tetratricopeptide (TPR) repeat protein
VTTPLPSENTGARDAAVVVAIEQYPDLPGIPGAHRNGQDWGRFLVNLLGVPAARVTELHDSNATRAAILDSVRRAAAQAEPGGRVWFVFIGHGRASLVPSDAGDGRDVRRLFSQAEVAEAAARDVVQLVSVLDVGFDKEVFARLGERPGRARPAGPLPIVLGASPGGPLPGDGRPAISYLLLGALRGWADSNGDGQVTAREAVDFMRHTLTTVAGWHKEPAQPYLGANFDCQAAQVLSTLREPAPNFSEIIPPRGRSAPEAALRATREAVAKADELLHRATALYEESGHQQGFPERRDPRFVGEGKGQEFEVVAMPSEVSEAAAVRVAGAAKLGGPEVSEAAQLLVEAAMLHLAYGDLEPARNLLSAVHHVRCGWDQAGFTSWMNLIGIAARAGNDMEVRRLFKKDCSFDEASDQSLRGTRQSLTWPEYFQARQLYQRAEKETDPEVAGCMWSAVGKEYEVLLRAAPTRTEQPEAALNGAYAYRAVDQPDAAAAMYQVYLGAQAKGFAGEAADVAATRHRYCTLACQEYSSLVKEVPRLRPGFVDVCVNQSWLNCTVERDACNGITNAKPLERPGVLAMTPTERAAEALSQRARGREELAGWEWRDTDRLARLGEAVDLYRAAEGAWASITAESHDTRLKKGFELLRLAEARTHILTLGRATGGAPAPEQVTAAETAARAARDASFDDTRREAAALLVDIADSGLEPTGQPNSAAKAELPQPVRAIRARDEYLTQIQATRDIRETRNRFAYEAAQWFLQYGQLGEARARLEPLYARECGRTRLGFDAWASLLGTAVLEGDVVASRRLTAARPSCAIDEETRLLEAHLTKPRHPVIPYLEPLNILDATDKLPAGPARRDARRAAAAALRQAVDEAPRREGAPDATLTAARVYQELGEPTRAIELYARFIEQYATDPVLESLDKGSPRAQPPVTRDPKRYVQRVKGLEEAYGALAALQATALDHRAAALTYSRESARARLLPHVRLEAARRAVALCDGRGVPGTLRALRKILAELRAPVAEQRHVEEAAKRATAALPGGPDP